MHGYEVTDKESLKGLGTLAIAALGGVAVDLVAEKVGLFKPIALAMGMGAAALIFINRSETGQQR